MAEGHAERGTRQPWGKGLGWRAGWEDCDQWQVNKDMRTTVSEWRNRLLLTPGCPSSEHPSQSLLEGVWGVQIHSGAVQALKLPNAELMKDEIMSHFPAAALLLPSTAAVTSKGTAWGSQLRESV
ncbi:hypothetical protein P7K49_030527 [Saguinus oedipus]|uniref:Uncharacterized protein n=1 Tax=Saguinus oedipus TaxID=9490 RepID=A0ABQ9U2F6_SAGOE|nr:hypothetical protein P7K49_030527 [Saguinus oedipus]